MPAKQGHSNNNRAEGGHRLSKLDIRKGDMLDGKIVTDLWQRQIVLGDGSTITREPRIRITAYYTPDHIWKDVDIPDDLKLDARHNYVIEVYKVLEAAYPGAEINVRISSRNFCFRENDARTGVDIDKEAQQIIEQMRLSMCWLRPEKP